MRIFLSIIMMASCVSVSGQDNAAEKIRLNQVGFLPEGPKVAIVMDPAATEFYVEESGKKVFEGKLKEGGKSAYVDRKVKVADFSALKKAGNYVVVVPGIGKSWPFEINAQVYGDLSKAAIKAFYFHRFSTELPERYAGLWKRPKSHPDDKVYIHASAATAARPEGTVIASPRGWMDAGDYNKYVVNSGITTATLLSAYEDFPVYYKNLGLNIPESGNALPDILDEVLWNLRWMMTMQDPADGGVYHKCTNEKFDAMVMPHEAPAKRYVVAKSTAAALNLTAVAAQAARIFRPFAKELPGLSDSCLSVSQRAWEWAKNNPDVLYRQDEMNKTFDPDIVTGAYGDRDVSDEFFWAACELFATTGDPAYIQSVDANKTPGLPVPTWNQVKMLGFYTLLRAEKSLSPEMKTLLNEQKKTFLSMMEELVTKADARDFLTVMGTSEKDFVWGSSAVAANQGIALLKAHQLVPGGKFLSHAKSNLDYLLGRNATGYSFVTGFGDKRVMHPHHRPSEADGIAEPVPGWLSGGPNPGMQDKCPNYPSKVPDEAFVDDVCSYASNEVAINWNAPLVYLVGGIMNTR